MYKFIALATLIGFNLYSLIAQGNYRTDTIVLSVPEVDCLFFENNFELLAAKYQISEAEAAIIQAKLWDNPSLSVNSYSKPQQKWYNISNNGEIALSLQQLIYLAGKRNKRINIEKFNLQIAQYQFYDLIRTLHHELRTSFFGLFFLQQSLKVYDKELTALKSLLSAYTLEYQKGNIPFIELARLQTLQFNLENEKIEFLKKFNETQNEIILLIGDSLSRPIKPLLDVSSFDKLSADSLNLSQLINLGLSSRFDLQIADAQIHLEQANLSLQKAIRVPDFTLGATYDRAQGFIPNSYAISLGIDLPVWNRNQGNIKAAENRIEESKILRIEKELEIKNDIKNAFVQLIEADRLYKSSIQKFDNNYDKLFEGIITAYQNHTISLLEFIDYYESYKNSKSEYFQLQNNRLEAIEDLNMAIGKTIME